MKTILFLGVLFTFGFVTRATAQPKNRKDSVQVTINLNNAINKNTPVDSVLVIFDRFNLTAAGAVKQVFYPQKNIVTIDNVPEGKYFISVICLGIYKDNFSETSYVYEKRRNKNYFEFKLRPCEPYIESDVYIPDEKINLSNLSVVRQKNRK